MVPSANIVESVDVFEASRLVMSLVLRQEGRARRAEMTLTSRLDGSSSEDRKACNEDDEKIRNEFQFIFSQELFNII